MKRYNDYDNGEDFYSSERKSVKNKPDYYEDISSDYTPEEKTRFTPRSNADFIVTRPNTQETGNRKFYDDTLLNKKFNPPTQPLTAAQLRQQELEERRRAREAQEAVRRQPQQPNDAYESDRGRAVYYSDNYKTDYSAAGYEQYSSRRDLEDTMEGIPLSERYYDDDGYVPARGGAGGQPPRKGSGGYPGGDSSNDRNRGGKKKKKKRHPLRTLLIVLLVLLLAGGGTAYGLLRNTLGGLNQTEISDLSKLGISDAIDQKYGNQSIINFALFGIDTHEDESMQGLSDSIIIVSVNRKTGGVKMISILRDSLVSIEGHGKQKITHAYSYGGAELAINTINQNFDMNIQDYATVNFAKMAGIIDTLGGIDLEITDFEWEYANGIGQSTYGKKNYEDIPEPGQVHLTGPQAVSFARIRSDSDVNRAERQRKVLNLLVDKIKSTSILKYPALLKQLMSYVETSMTYDEILGFAPLALKQITIEQTSVPDEEMEDATGGYNNGNWVWKFDKEKAADRIHRFIYENDNSASTL